VRTKCFIYVLLAHENNSTSLFCTQSAQAMGYHCGTEYTGDGVSLLNRVHRRWGIIAEQSTQGMGYHCGTEYTGDGVSLRNGVEANANVIVWFEPTRV
jgi:hypothetical protein